MNWAGVDRMLANLPVPQGYRLEQLARSDIPELIGGLKDWYPDITVGAVGCYLREDFYLRHVFLAGEPEKDVMVLVCEAVYIKVLVPDAELLRPKPEYLTAKTKALFDVLFPE